MDELDGGSSNRKACRMVCFLHTLGTEIDDCSTKQCTRIQLNHANYSLANLVNARSLFTYCDEIEWNRKDTRELIGLKSLQYLDLNLG